MAGEARSTAFMLGAATVMLGPQADVLKLVPETHSIGLVKNFTVTNEQQYAELTHGVMQNIIFSQVNQITTRCNMEVYEYTAQNMTYALGLDGTSVTTYTPGVLKTQVVGDGSTTDDFVISSATDISTSYPVGSWIMLQASGAETYDKVYVGKVTGVAWSDPNDELTITCSGHPVPVGMTFAAGDVISRVNFIQIGSKAANPYLGAKVVGILPDGNRPVTMIFPKVRITQGFNISFKVDDYGNMPFEFTPYDLVSTDSLYSQFGGLGYGFIWRQ